MSNITLNLDGVKYAQVGEGEIDTDDQGVDQVIPLAITAIIDTTGLRQRHVDRKEIELRPISTTKVVTVSNTLTQSNNKATQNPVPATVTHSENEAAQNTATTEPERDYRGEVALENAKKGEWQKILVWIKNQESYGNVTFSSYFWSREMLPMSEKRRLEIIEILNNDHNVNAADKAKYMKALTPF